MKMVKAEVTPSGSAGSASGTSWFNRYPDGKLYGVYLDYASGLTSGTNVYIKLEDPAINVFAREGSATDGWFFPRYWPVTSTAGAYAVEERANPYMLPVSGRLQLSVTGSSNVGAITAYLYIEEG